MRRFTIVVVAATLWGARPAVAQDHGPVALTMGYPGTVGAVWHLADRVAVRSAIAWSRTSLESGEESPIALPTTPFPPLLPPIFVRSRISTSAWNVSPGVDLLLFVARWDAVRAYIAPGYAYRRSSSTTTVTFEALSVGGVQVVSGSTFTERSEQNGHEVRGAFGVQYAPHRRFGLFGELGLRHSTSEGPNGVGETRLTNQFSAVGVSFYF